MGEEKVYVSEENAVQILTKVKEVIFGEENYSLSVNGNSQFIETTPEGVKTTTFNLDGSITEVYPDGKTYTTTFEENDSVTRVLEESQV